MRDLFRLHFQGVNSELWLSRIPSSLVHLVARQILDWRLGSLTYRRGAIAYLSCFRIVSRLASHYIQLIGNSEAEAFKNKVVRLDKGKSKIADIAKEDQSNWLLGNES